ncbi:hypothetical protein HanPI659440_Chr08g0298241 [Helianthus annuus]|nr:hypothetical protein HanPI659440_Chr08g0298241 [Helianthus annuus]
MYQEHASWEKYQERLSAEAREFEQMKNTFLVEKASFEKEKKSEKWGRVALKTKLHAAEEPMAKERQEGKKICDNDNKQMYGKVEEAQADRERVEVELNAQIVNKNKDLAAKDVEITELECRLYEAHEKSESLEIDLAAEKVKADTAEEARKAAEEAGNISTSALNVAQNNYAEAQSIVDTLVSESEWMRNHGIAAVSVSFFALGYHNLLTCTYNLVSLSYFLDRLLTPYLTQLSWIK